MITEAISGRSYSQRRAAGETVSVAPQQCNDAVQQRLLRLLLASRAEGAQFELIQFESPSIDLNRPPINFIRITHHDLQAIVKFRHRPIAEREQLVYHISRWTGAEAVGACIAVELAAHATARHGRVDQTNASMIDLICAAAPDDRSWCIVEQCVRLISTMQPHDSLTERLVNQFGWCDLCQAFLATPTGAGLIETKTSASSCTAMLSEQQFATLLSLLDSCAFEDLWLISLLTELADSHAANLMLRRNSSDGKFVLLAVDTNRAFGESSSSSDSDSDSESSTESDNDNTGSHGYVQHEYPIMLELGLANATPSTAIVRRVMALDPGVLQHTSWSTDPHNAHLQARAAEQLSRLQLELSNRSSDSTLRDIAFEVMPSWGRAWTEAECLGLRRPLYEQSNQ